MIDINKKLTINNVILISLYFGKINTKRLKPRIQRHAFIKKPFTGISCVVSGWTWFYLVISKGNSGTTGCLLPNTEAAQHPYWSNGALTRQQLTSTGKLRSAKLQLIPWYVILERNCSTCNFCSVMASPFYVASFECQIIFVVCFLLDNITNIRRIIWHF